MKCYHSPQVTEC